MLILLPPSEGKTPPRRGRPIHFEEWPSDLAPAREEVLAALMRLCQSDPHVALTTLGIGPTLVDEVERNADLLSAPTARADRVYSGVLYEALDVAGLSNRGRRRATSQVVITSALFGLVRLHEPIPAYRLGGGVNLPGVGPVAAFWRERLDPVVRRAAGTGLVVDLRSTTYAAFWRPEEDLAARVATVRVLHEHHGTRKVVSHFNKATKGRLVRSLLEDGRDARTPTAFAQCLTDLGWTVELGEPTTRGTRVDVVVSDL